MTAKERDTGHKANGAADRGTTPGDSGNKEKPQREAGQKP